MITKLAGQSPDLSSQKQTPSKESAERLRAAQQFEGLLVRQLLSVMRKTAQTGGLGTSGGASGQYLSMFDEAIADTLSEGPGIGMAASFAEAMGATPEELETMQSLRSSGMATSGAVPYAPGAVRASSPMPHIELPRGLSGSTEKLAMAAYGMAAPGGGKQWAVEGTLSRRDLSSAGATTTRGDENFSVEEAGGYKDAFKCNLFALEAARRAGYQVPVMARANGVGFPTSNVITNDVADGRLEGGWAVPVSKADHAEMVERVNRGEAGMLLTGSGSEGRRGHMAVVERIHEVRFDKEGNLEHIVFDGWEARQDGAQHLERRSWNRFGHGDDSKLARNGFERMHMLALKPAEAGKNPEIPVSFRAMSIPQEEKR